MAEREMLARASAYLAAPYRLRGADPVRGWDCLGCVRYLRRELFGRESPWPEYDRRTAVDEGERARALEGRAAWGWRPVEPLPGAALLFSEFGRPAHVGLLLTARLFIHAFDPAVGTAIDDVRLRPWRDRLRGAFDCP